MKKSLLFFGLLTVCFLFVNAQDKYTFGPRLGFTLIPIERTENLGTNFQFGFNGGAYFNYHFNNKFSLRPELNYSLKKQTTTQSDTSDLLNSLGGGLGFNIGDLNLPEGINLNVYSNTKNLHSLHYIEIPVLASVQFSNIQISAGPYAGFLLAAKTKSETRQEIPALSLVDLGDQIPFIDFFINTLFPGYNEPVTDVATGTSGFRKIDVGIIGDITYQLENNFNFGIRYQQGLIDFRENYTGDKKLNNSVQVLFGWRFSAGKKEVPRVKSYKYEGN